MVQSYELQGIENGGKLDKSYGMKIAENGGKPEQDEAYGIKRAEDGGEREPIEDLDIEKTVLYGVTDTPSPGLCFLFGLQVLV